MSAKDRAQNDAEKIAGSAKEAVGKVAGNDRLVAEGKTDQVKADIKNKVEDVKDVFRK